MLTPDPLKIVYVVVQADDRLEEVSPFQGFGTSWPSSLWALRFLTLAPSSFLDRGMPLQLLLAQRMGGANRLSWVPLRIGALEASDLDDFGFVTVVCIGEGSVGQRVARWCSRQRRPVLQVEVDDIHSDKEAAAFFSKHLRDHCRIVLQQHGDTLSGPRLQAASHGIDKWLAREPTVGIKAPGGHNITLPNEMALLRAERFLEPQKSFIAMNEAAYDAHAVASAQSVIDVAEDNGLADFNRLYLPLPRLILTEPAMYRPSYQAFHDKRKSLSKPMRDALRRLQTQTGLCSTMVPKTASDFLADSGAQAIVAARAMELKIHSYGIGLMAAQTCSAVLRLRPAVNHVFPALSRFARNIRATSPAAPRKTPSLFLTLQRELRDAVGQARIEFIERCDGPIKIISDAPIELLPVGELTLGLRYDCSRINATPGNLMMAELVGRGPVLLDLAALRKVLVISAFKDTDRLRNLMEDSLEVMTDALAGCVEIRFVRVRNTGELIDALNASNASILVFDGHGLPGGQDGVGAVDINGELLDVWTLRGKARIPPIVILSACDTHSMDAANHATTANGFIAAGAMTTLATLLPIGGREGAVFVCRLLYRLSKYLPAAFVVKARVLNWCEIVTGMLRMVLGFDLVAAFIADKDAAHELRTKANLHINTDNPEWHSAILDDIAQASKMDLAVVRKKAYGVLSASEAIRYVQIGSPEFIRVDDGSVAENFFPPGLAERLGVD